MSPSPAFHLEAAAASGSRFQAAIDRAHSLHSRGAEGEPFDARAPRVNLLSVFDTPKV